jgi:hypothetical protein
MSNIQVEVIGAATNATVIRLPGRRFPGIVVQGDSLAILTSTTKALVTALSDGQLAKAREDATELDELLSGLKSAYEDALHQAGLELPYPSSDER